MADSGKQLSDVNFIEQIMAQPQVLLDRNLGEIKALLGEPEGWAEETLSKGAHRGQGWVLREYGTDGQPTGRMVRWHPGGGHHGPEPYWRVNSYQAKSPVISAGI